MPKRVQMTRNKPWRKDNPDAVIVSRFKGGKWDNPFTIAAIYNSFADGQERLGAEFETAIFSDLEDLYES